MAKHYLCMATAIMLLAIPGVAGAQSDLVLELRLNNTSHDVYESPDHAFVASYLAGLLTGLAGGSGTVGSGSGTGYHTIMLSQAMGERAYLAFSQGDWQAIDTRMDDIESGDFLDYVSPSFAFGLGSWHPLKVVLAYTGIDIDGGLTLSKGIYKLVIENKGQGGGRPLVEIRDV